MYHCFFSISESTSTSTPTQGSRLRLEFRAPERGDTTRDNQTRTLRYQCVGAVCSDSCIRRKEQRPAVCGWEPYVVIPASRLWLLLPRAISVLPRRVPQDLGSGCSFRAPERASSWRDNHRRTMSVAKHHSETPAAVKHHSENTTVKHRPQ